MATAHPATLTESAATESAANDWAATDWAAASRRVMRIGLALSGLVWFSLLSAGCGSSEYNAQVEATAAELRRNQPDEPEEEPEAAKAPAEEPDPIYNFDEEGEGAGGTAVGNAIGLAPM